MTHTYKVTGMTCGNCVAKVKSALLKMPEVDAAEVQLSEPQASIAMSEHVPVSRFQEVLQAAGNYTITEANAHMAEHSTAFTDTAQSWLETYKPILLILGYLLAVTFTVEYVADGFNLMRWMQHFMAGFFLVFSFFKLLNLRDFASSYAMYDILAKRWQGWGYVYAFIELALGLAFLSGFYPVLTNAVTLLVMSVSIIGVLQSVLNKQKIRCACLGAVFNLPMSSITIIEDATMIAMSAAMLIYLI